MRSIRYNVSFLLVLSCFNNASEEKKVFESWMVQKLQGLEAAVKKAANENWCKSSVLSTEDRKEVRKSKQLHGQFYRVLTGPDVDMLASVNWLRFGNLFGETEGFACAIADEIIKTNNYRKYIMKDGCQRYLAHSYKYEHMYPIDGIEFDNVVVKKTQGDLTYFEKHFAVKAAKDGIIILSPTANPGDRDLVFEIGIGINSNQFTILRLTKNSKLNEITRVNTQNILSTTEYTNFYIKISEDVLMFGREGDSPLISYFDSRLRTVKFFDMTSWGDSDAKFLYDCPETSQIYCYYKSA